MHFLYNILIWLAMPFILAYHVYRSVSRNRPAALGARFGFVSADELKRLGGLRPVWVHAVSVGETIAVKPLLTALKKEYPDTPIILSNMTETGRLVASGLATVDLSLYFPFDYSFAVRMMLEKINPRLVVVVETELWPNFFRSARTLGIPVMVVNGRISDRSYGRYLKLRGFFRRVLADLSACCMQSAEDARRIIQVGAPEERVLVTRNLKFDIPAGPMDQEQHRLSREKYRIPEDMPVFTAGSTHQGEEELVLSAYKGLLAQGKRVMLVLVPRHPERAAQVAALVAAHGLSCRCRSSLSREQELFAPGEVLLVDTVGELLSIYALSELVFVGGSLVAVGGHNLLEPASVGKAALFGPHMGNFREIAAMTASYGAARQVSGGEELATAAAELMADEGLRSAMGENGLRLVREQGGATSLNMEVIRKLVGGA